jgi:hypothetical protein
MPILAIGEEGDGRTVALGVDGTWRLGFSELGARTAGRGYGALWDGLLGWLMRDPRFEPAQIEIPGGCTAGLPSTLRARILPAPNPAQASSATRVVQLEVTRLDEASPPIHIEASRPADASSIDLKLPPLESGGYTARLRVEDGAAARRDFACEAGGDEWADSRPDPNRLQALAKATGGTFAFASAIGSLRLPSPTVMSAERHVAPVAPQWVWTLAAATLLGLHWIIRRRSGLP